MAGGDAWRAGVRWRPVEGRGTRDPWETVSTICAVASVAVLLSFAFTMKKASGGPGTSGKDPMLYISIAMLIYLPAALIDLRRFKQINAKQKMRTIVELLAAVIAVLYFIGRWTGHELL